MGGHERVEHHECAPGGHDRGPGSGGQDQLPRGGHPGKKQAQHGPSRQSEDRQNARELGQDRQTGRDARGDQHRPSGRDRPVTDQRDPGPKSQGQGDEQQRLAIGLGHGPVRMQPVERVDRQQDGRDPARRPVLDECAEQVDRHAAQGPHQHRGQPCDHQVARRAPPVGRVVVPGHRRFPAGTGDPRDAERGVDEILGEGNQVVGQDFQPGRVVGPPGEDEIRLIALGDVGVLVHERLVPQAQREEPGRENPDQSRGPARRSCRR